MTELNSCQSCGMHIEQPNEFHPYAYCLMFKGCNDGNTVRKNAEFILNTYANTKLDRFAKSLHEDIDFTRRIESTKSGKRALDIALVKIDDQLKKAKGKQ